MKKTLTLIAVVMLAISSLALLSFRDAPAPSPRVDQMIADWERAKAYTKEYLDAATEDAVKYKPTPEMRSFAEQMLHLTMGNVGITSSATGKERLFKDNIEKMDEYKNKVALTKVVMEGYDYVIAALKTMDDAKLDEKVKMFNGQEYTRAVIFGKVFEHQTHHRGQTTVYLRLAGVTPPNEKLF